jgi:hypothetical protein
VQCARLLGITTRQERESQQEHDYRNGDKNGSRAHRTSLLREQLFDIGYETPCISQNAYKANDSDGMAFVGGLTEQDICHQCDALTFTTAPPCPVTPRTWIPIVRQLA